ncbi:MAG: RNA polymerase sigma factor [Chitinophagaceae bacterium]
MSLQKPHTNLGQGSKPGEEVAYDHLFREYFPALCYFARRFLKQRYDPEDLVMDCFAKLWEKRVSLQHPETVKTFLYTTVRNACIDLLRKKNIPVIPVASHEESLHDEEANFISFLIEAEVFREIFSAAEHLPQQIKKVFQLYFVEGKNEREISEELKTSYHTVRNQRQRAVALLKEKLQIPKK